MGRVRKKARRSESCFSFAMVTPTVVVLLVMSVFALIFTFYYSFTDYYYISLEGPVFNGLDNYIALFKDPYFIRAIWNTVYFTVVCTVVETVYGLGMAVYVHRMKRFKKIMRTLLLLPYLLPTVTVALIWRMMLSSNYGILNRFLEFLHLPVHNWFYDVNTAMPTLIVIDIWQTAPFVFLLIYASLQSVPETLYEAARIDGANKWREFLHVTMPSIKGTVILCLLLRTIDSFRMFDKVNVLTQGGPANTTSTITQYIYTYGIKSLDFGFGSAGAVVMAVLVLVLSSVYIQRTFRKV